MKHLFSQHKSICRGFSLIELLVALGISVSIMTALVSLFVTSTDISRETKLVHDVNAEGVWVSTVLEDLLHNGRAITTPAIGSQGSSLVFTTPAGPSTTISLSGGVLQAAIGGGATRALTSSRVVVSDLIFKNLSRPSTPGTVQFQFTLTSATGKTPYQKTFTGSGTIRLPNTP